MDLTPQVIKKEVSRQTWMLCRKVLFRSLHNHGDSPIGSRFHVISDVHAIEDSVVLNQLGHSTLYFRGDECHVIV